MVLAKISQATSGFNKVVTGPEFPWPCKDQIQRSQPTERVETAATYFVAGPRGDLFLVRRVGIGLPDWDGQWGRPGPGDIGCPLDRARPASGPQHGASFPIR